MKVPMTVSNNGQLITISGPDLKHGLNPEQMRAVVKRALELAHDGAWRNNVGTFETEVEVDDGQPE